jgi:hypothetical protein
MEAHEELLSLKECPLPDEEIKDPLTMVYQLDGDIEKLEKRLADVRSERERYLKYALEHKIERDSECELKTLVKHPNQTVNIDLLKATYKKAWERIWEGKKQEAKDALDLFGGTPEECKAKFSVNQIDAKKALKAEGVIIDVVLQRVGEDKVEYSVVKIR